MEQEHTAPALPALIPEPTKRGDRLVRLGDYLGRYAGYARTMQRRRVLTRSGKVIDADTLRRVEQPAKSRDPDNVRRLYAVKETGLVIAPMPTPPLPDRKEIIVRWIMARAAEPSTWRGLLLCLTSIGIAVEPEFMEAVTAVGIALAGLVGVLFPDQPAG